MLTIRIRIRILLGSDIKSEYFDIFSYIIPFKSNLVASAAGGIFNVQPKVRKDAKKKLDF